MYLSFLIHAACTDLNARQSTKIELTMFLLMGFGGAFVWHDISKLSPGFVLLMLAGGLSYLFGIIFFVLGFMHKPIYHVVWHLFVILGAGTHWFLHYLYVVGMSLDDCLVFLGVPVPVIQAAAALNL